MQRAADALFERGAGDAFVAEHDLAGREGALSPQGRRPVRAPVGRKLEPDRQPVGEAEEVEAEAALDSGGSRAEATFRVSTVSTESTATRLPEPMGSHS